VERFDVPDPNAPPARLPPGRTEPTTVQEISPQIDFLYRATDNFTQSVQFADAKAGGVVLILSIGILDLFRHLRDFLDARDLSAVWGWTATVACIIATVFGILTVVQIARTLFPRRRPGMGSLFFFGVVGAFSSPKEYEEAVWLSSERELVRSMATTAWNVAGIASEKYKHLRLAYGAALLFAIFWAIARLGFSLAH
jgi:Pycsar effector protein